MPDLRHYTDRVSAYRDLDAAPDEAPRSRIAVPGKPRDERWSWLQETGTHKERSISISFYTYLIDAMATVKVSPKFQVVIPQKVRERLKITPGQRVEVLLYDNRIELVPVKPMRQMRGFLKGIDPTVEREQDRSL